MKKLLCTLLSSVLLAGCISNIGEYSVLSNRNIDITHSKNFSRGSIVSGYSGSVVVGIFQLGTPDVNEALKEAIDKDRCTVALTDVTVKHASAYLFYGVHNVQVTGRQLLDTSLPGCGNRR